ncbi:MAG: hypothetical protein ACM3JG_17355 [Thiohalocapsa sp.]
MLAKASLTAGAVLSAAVAFASIDFRQLYNEMYPVNGLRRDVLNLCHEAKPTFVRAIEADRVGCYDSMPDPVELAIGWVRTSSRLASMHQPTPVEVAERLLIAAIGERRLERLTPAQFTGYAMATGGAAYPAPACEEGAGEMRPAAPAAELALKLPGERLALRLAHGEDAASYGLGRGIRPVAPAAAELPVLSLGGAGDSVAPQEIGDRALVRAPAADAGGDPAPLLLPPLPAAASCRTPA